MAGTKDCPAVAVVAEAMVPIGMAVPADATGARMAVGAWSKAARASAHPAAQR